MPQGLNVFLNINGLIIGTHTISTVYITSSRHSISNVLVIKLTDGSELLFKGDLEKLHNLHSELSKYLDVIDIPTDIKCKVI